MSASASPAEATLTPAEIDALLSQLRHSMAGWQDVDGLQRIEAALAAQPSAAQHIELKALAQFFALNDRRESALTQLQFAKELQLAAQQLGATLAEAAAWRLLLGLQLLLKQHHAALYSAGMAATLYRSCGEAGLAQAMVMSRMNVYFQMELYKEQLDATLSLMAEAQALDPPFQHRALNSAAGACYCLSAECADETEHRAWLRRSQRYQEEALALVQTHGLALLAAMSHLNISVVFAMLGDVAEARAHFKALEKDDAPLLGRPGWRAWRRLSECLIEAQDPALPAPQTWAALVALADELDQESLNDSAAREACLNAIARLGPRLNHADDALRAAEELLRLQRQRRRSLSQAFGDTFDAVMAQPQLLQQQQLLVEQGSVLEQALAARNAELSQALAKLQTEATIRQSAEAALQQAHDELELRVQQRSAELQRASLALMQQEKQLSLAQLVASSASDMAKPLAQAEQAAASLGELHQQLRELPEGAGLRRRELEQRLQALSQASACTDQALEQIAQLVQRFKALGTAA